MKQKASDRPQVSYRPVRSRHDRLRKLAFDRKITIQAIIDRALDEYLGNDGDSDELTEPERRAVERFLECYRTTSPERRDLLLGLIEEFRGRQA